MSAVQAVLQKAVPLSACSASNIPQPKIPGLEFNQLRANIVQGYSKSFNRGEYIGHEAWNVDNLDFCNVSLTYNHVNHRVPINVQVWLPVGNSWNGRLMGVGGGGWSAGLFEFSFRSMYSGVSEGYVTVSTDAGHDPNVQDVDSWALTESGKVDMYQLQNFAHVAQGDTAKIGKIVSESFYGMKPEYSYWDGCSTGGRQGLMLAQRDPDAYDGIFAMAPAINWAQFIPSLNWPQFVMDQLGQYPHECELNALTAAAIAHCDYNDGIWDGVISDPDACMFDPEELLDQVVDCPSTSAPVRISAAAVQVAKEAWSGPRTVHGQRLWYGISPEANLSGPFNLATTICDDSPKCRGDPFRISSLWLKYFVANNPKLDLTTLNHIDYEKLFNESSTRFNSIMGTNDPDLSAFRDAGGKMITIHGLADQVIPSGGTKQYYDAVLATDPSAPNYYKYFEAPGIAHCFNGPGPFPGNAFNDLVAWVEQGIEPETLLASTSPNSAGEVFERPLCQYPLVARYGGTGDMMKAHNYYCAESYLSATPIRVVLERARRELQRYMNGQTPVVAEK